MAYYWTDLADVVRASGLPVVEVEAWRTRGHGGFARNRPDVITGHHTGTPARAKGDYPSLNIVTKGRSDLPGPLSQLGLGRSGTVFVIAAGVAYHAGKSEHAGFTDLNRCSVGIEAEHPGAGPWPDTQLDAYPRLVAALCRGYGLDPSRYVSHRDCALPPGRKPDPAGITDEWMRATVRSLMAAGGDDDMTPEDRRKLNEIHDRVCRLEAAWDGGVTDDRKTPYDMRMLANRNNVEVRQAWQDIKAMRAELGAALRAILSGDKATAGVDPKAVAEAVVAEMIERMR